jgi:hypothetical protein
MRPEREGGGGRVCVRDVVKEGARALLARCYQCVSPIGGGKQEVGEGETRHTAAGGGGRRGKLWILTI